MLKREFYVTPEVEIIEIAVECGFSLSSIVGGSDYEDGGEGTEMD